MNIFGHIIKDTEIIGIGPLVDNCSFEFELHLRNHTTVIRANDVRKYEWDELYSEYQKVRENIADQIDEILPEAEK
jgi:hypothetical protein